MPQSLGAATPPWGIIAVSIAHSEWNCNEPSAIWAQIVKLELLKGKCIVFVNDVDRCYRVKLFLEQLGIRSCVLNAELPLNSRFILSVDPA